MTYLGLDVGGTHCRHAFFPPHTGPCGSAAGVQPLVHGEAAAVEQVAARLDELCSGRQVIQAVVAMAGAGERGLADRLAAGLRSAGVVCPVVVSTDVVAVAAETLRWGPALALWSGTGSFAVARSADGRLHRSGGRGFLLGDEGSGYDLVRNAARAAVAAADGRGPETALAVALAEAFAVPSILRLGATLQRLDTRAVGAAMPTVLAVAAAGDRVAQQVLDDGAAALVALAESAAARAGLPSGTDVTLGGGVLRNAIPMRARVESLLVRSGAHVYAVDDEFAAAHGAARLAAGWHGKLHPHVTWLTDDAP